MSVPQLKDWPTPIAPALREIVDALKKRSKAIKGKTGTGKFNISLVSDDVKGERFERLNLAITLFTNADQYTDIRLAFWDDFLLRIDIRRPATGRDGTITTAGLVISRMFRHEPLLNILKRLFRLSIFYLIESRGCGVPVI